MEKCSPISPAESLPAFSRFRISRRTGSDSARSVACMAIGSPLSFNLLVNYKRKPGVCQ